MEVGLIITVLIALIGWGIAIWQMYLNRKWQKRDALANRRYDVYSKFLENIEHVYAELTKSPTNRLRKEREDFNISTIGGDRIIFYDAAGRYNEALITFMKETIAPIPMLNREAIDIKLIASEDIQLKIDYLLDILKGIYNDYESTLANVDIHDYKTHKTILDLQKDSRIMQLKELKIGIESQMKKEIQTK